MRILTEPKNALCKQYRKLLEYDQVKLSFEEGALEAIAEKAIERKIGARGLRAIMESTMMDVMFDAPSDNTIQECRITREAVEKKAQPVLVHGEPAPLPRRSTKRRTGGRPETA